MMKRSAYRLSSSFLLRGGSAILSNAAIRSFASSSSFSCVSGRTKQCSCRACTSPSFFSSNGFHSSAACRHDKASFSFVQAAGMHKPVTSVVVGLWEGARLTNAGEQLNAKTNGRLKRAIEASLAKGKEGEVKTFYGLFDTATSPAALHAKASSGGTASAVSQMQTDLRTRVVVVGLGKEEKEPEEGGGTTDANLLNADAVRRAAQSAVAALTKDSSSKIYVEPFDNYTRQAAEGALIGAWSFDELKSLDPKHPEKIHSKDVQVELMPVDYRTHQKDMSAEDAALFGAANSANAGITAANAWALGAKIAESQNLVRYLAEMPGNLMTPTIFGDYVSEKLHSIKNEALSVQVQDKKWIQSQNMGAFLAVSQGSAQEPRFMEVRYNGAPEDNTIHVALVGKGITFDSGGISIKPSTDMGLMRGDMAGAASVMGAMYGIASLKLPINVVAVTPLCENMPSGSALKPGDVIKARNGTTIEVDNTDAEGRLILADALNYASTTYEPNRMLDVATLTGAMDVALGSAVTGVFATTDALWREIERAGLQSGDHVWRMPFLKEYAEQLKSTYADVKNVGGKSAGACTAAAFLKKFIGNTKHYAHLDIAGVAWGHRGNKAMTGRPVRALIEFANIAATNKKL